MHQKLKMPNKALHRTTIPLRSIAAGELGRYRKGDEDYACNTLGYWQTIN